MVLEAVVITVDNSEYMRNGDYSPSRYDAQLDACNLIFGRKTEDNAESALALMSAAGDKAEVHVALTLEIGDVITALQKVKIYGKLNFIQSMKKAILVLLHKRNPNQGLRIISFIGSPVYDKNEDLVSLGESLKKHRIAVDVISFGETDLNDAKLEAFHAAVNNNGNSNLVKVPTGLGISLSDYLRNTPILSGGEFQGGGGDTSMGEFGINPNTDPELYAALQESMRTYQSQSQDGTSTTPSTGNNTNNPPPVVDNLPHLDPDGDVPMYDDEIKRAIELSLQTGESQGTINEHGTPNNAVTNTPTDNTSNNNNNPPEENKDIGVEDLEDVLTGLDGVNINDPGIQSFLSNLKKDDKKDKKDDKKEDK